MAVIGKITTALVDTNGNKLFHPYIGCSGYLLVIPVYSDVAAGGAGGPVHPGSVPTDPTLIVGGVTRANPFVSPPGWTAGTKSIPLQKHPTTNIFADPATAAIIYLLAQKIVPGDAVTLSMADGWALTSGGADIQGSGGSPMAITNWSGQATDWPAIAPTMGIGFNLHNIHSGSGHACQVMANWFRRTIFNNTWNLFTTTVTGRDVRGLPTTLANTTGQAFGTDIDGSGGFSVTDGGPVPSLWGTFDIVYSDGSAGVGSGTGPKLNFTLVSGNASGWTATELGTPFTTAAGFAMGNVIDQGTWDAAADNGRGGVGVWKNIKKRVRLVPVNATDRTKAASAWARLKCTPASGLGSVANPISIPPQGDGMALLAVFPPSAVGSTKSTLEEVAPYGFGNDLALASAPEAVCPTFVTRFQGSGIRWMKAMPGGSGGKGDGLPITAAQVTNGAIRRKTDFLTSVGVAGSFTINVASIGPLGAGADNMACSIALDYAAVAGYPQSTADMTTTAWLGGNGNPSAKNAFIRINCATPHGLVTGEFMAVNSGSQAPIPLNYTGFSLTANVLAADTKLYVNTTTSGAGGNAYGTATVPRYWRLTDGTNVEYVTVNSAGTDGGGPFVNVTRARFATTAQNFLFAGTTVRPAITIGMSQDLSLVIDSTSLIAVYNIGDLCGSSVYTADTTLSYSTSPPTVTYSYPTNGMQGIPHVVMAKAVSKIAERDPSRRFLCWINLGTFATDAAVTAVVAEMIPYFASNVDLLVEPSNEVWNTSYRAYRRCTPLSQKAPNPETGGIGFGATNGLAWFFASRSARFSAVAKAAFTAAGLDPGRVRHGDVGRGQYFNAIQDYSRDALAYRQQYNLPVDDIWIDAYADLATASGDQTFVVGGHPMTNWMASLIPATAVLYTSRAAGPWTIDVTIQIIQDYLRAFYRYGVAQKYYYTGLWLTKLNNGQAIFGNPVNYTYTGKARAVVYEGTVEYLIPDSGNWDVSSPVLPNIANLSRDIVNHPGWYYCERAFYQGLQEGGYNYARTAGATVFPDPNDAKVRTLMLFDNMGPWGTGSAPDGVQGNSIWTLHDWQGQRAGRGDGVTARNDIVDGTLSSTNRLGYAPITPIRLANNAGGITATATVINVDDASALVASEFIRIDAEWMKIGNVVGNQLTGVSRHLKVPWSSGVVNTTAAAHNDGALVLPSGASFFVNPDGTYLDSTRAQAVTDWAKALAGQTVPTLTWANPANITYPAPLTGTQLNATSGGVAGTFTYTPPAGTVLIAGPGQTLSVLFTPTDTATYSTASKSVLITVLASAKIVPTITWANPTSISYPTALSATQLNATSGGVAGTFAYTPPSGTVLNAGAAQTLSVLFTPTDGVTYTTASKTCQLTVNRGVPSVTWSNPADMTLGQVLSSTQLNATCALPGTFLYTPPVGTMLPVGDNQELKVVFTPTDGTNWGSATKFVDVDVKAVATPVVSTITWPDPAPILFGTPLGPPQLNATANTGGTFVYTPPSGTILLEGDAQTLAVQFTPTDTVQYLPASATVQIDVQDNEGVVFAGAVVMMSMTPQYRQNWPGQSPLPSGSRPKS